MINKENIPLKKRIIKVIFIILGTFVFSVCYYFLNLKTESNEIRIFKKKADNWKRKVFEMKTKIAKIKKEIADKEKENNMNFSNEEIRELANVCNLFCKFLYQKNNIKCALQGIKRNYEYLNVIKADITVLNGNLKNAVITANLFSYFINKFIVPETNIRLKKVKIVNNNQIVIEFYKNFYKKERK